MTRIYFIVFLYLLSGCGEEPNSAKTEQANFNEISSHNGYYSSQETGDLTISISSFPSSLQNYYGDSINSVTLSYLTAIENGYLMTADIHYDKARRLAIMTLNEDYDLIDYKIYPNHNSGEFNPEDTISEVTFNQDGVTVELMHPNELEEPIFEVDGIAKDHLTISDQLAIKIR